MATQIKSNEIKKYLIENNPYIIVEKKVYPQDCVIDKEKIVFENLEHHQVLFQIGEFEKVDLVFVPNEKNDVLEIECYNEHYENVDTTKVVKTKERINISPGGDSLVPGKYLITLTRKQKTYEFLYEIVATNVKGDNLNIIRSYVDNHIDDLSRNKNSKVLITEKKCLMPIISNIINNPIIDISKDRNGKKIVTKDNVENKNLKNIVISLNQNEEYKQEGFDYFIEKTWLKEIKPAKIIKPTLRFLKNKNYGQIYEAYNLCLKEKQTPYKKSSSLFEIYSFLVVKNAIESLGFRWVSGWLKERMESCDLNKGEVLIFERQNQKIKLFFDKELVESKELVMSKSEVSQISSPSDIKCRRPDILIEVYEDDLFLDSMIIEAKYRKQSYVDTLYREMSNQLFAYRRVDFYDSNIKKVSNKKAVKKIILVYPKQESEKCEHDIYEDILFLPIDFKNPMEDIIFEIKELLNENEEINSLFVASTV